MKSIIRRTAVISVIIIIALCIYTACVNFVIINSTSENIYNHTDIPLENEYQCIIILGAGVRPDNSVSDVLKDRLEVGISVYNLGIAPKIIMSGDHGKKNYDEVNAMKKYAIDKGIASEDIFMDHAGFSTYESLYRAKEIFGVENAVIISQEYHLPRALYIAKELGINAIGVKADLHRYIYQAKWSMREYIARAKEFANLIIKPEPKYLGKTIPVWGDGNITNDKTIE